MLPYLGIKSNSIDILTTNWSQKTYTDGKTNR